MRALATFAIVTLALATSGCDNVRACRAGTLFVSVDGRAVGANAVRVTLTLDGVVKGTSPVYALPGDGTGTLEIDLRGDYAAGRRVVVDADALATGNVVVGHGHVDTTLAATCTPLTMPLSSTGGNNDLGSGDDLASAGSDLAAGGSDMTPPPIVPSHTPATFSASAPDLPMNITVINTTNFTYTAGGNVVTPGSSLFFDDGQGHAVLLAGAWTVQSAVRVVGMKPLIVIASKPVDVQMVIDASATNPWSSSSSTALPQPGPGGGPGGMGAGAGGAGVPLASGRPGGGGGGYYSPGAPGGSGANMTSGGTGGVMNGGMLAQFYGGSGGGNGYSAAGNCHGGTGSAVPGGAGGGAVQITSKVSITVRAGAGINVGGGGGTPGCSGNDNDGGGGGGSGGMIFLEAPTVTVAGTLAANGGGGGSGPGSTGTQAAGASGTLNLTAAAGGSNGESNGGNGAAGPTNPTPGGYTGGAGCGGGGGGLGRIWLRTRGGTPVTTGATFSPMPMTDATL